MARDDWFRRTAWTTEDEAAFQARLDRCRGGSSRKAQYLRIQAAHLAEAGDHESALSLLDRQLTSHPSRLQTAQSLLQRAESLAALGRRDEAIESYRASLRAQDDFPSVRTGCESSFAWYIAVRRIEDAYDEALELVERFESSSPDRLLPRERFQCAVVRALIAHERGLTSQARQSAALARQAASETHSGYQRHPTVGLVERLDSEVLARLTAIAPD